MRIITQTRIKEGIGTYPQWTFGLTLWLETFKSRNASFESYQQIKELWNETSGWNVDRVPARDVTESDFGGDFDLYIFDIHGTKCRLITRINTRHNIIFIREVMSHAEYDKWCKAKVR